MRPKVRITAALAIVFMVLVMMMSACTSGQNPSESSNAAAQLQAIPQADPAKYEHLRDMKTWRNPYLVIRADGVGLLDTADSVEILLKTEDLLGALAHLPASAWPYGRVVAATENSARGSEQDRIAIRRNKGIVGGILQGAHIVVDWVPSA